MNHFFILICCWMLTVISFGQNSDTCNYVRDNNNIGGLDCAMVSLAPFEPESFQWVNCDDNFNPFPGDTTGNYSSQSGVHVALVISYLGCIDTSYCQYVCSWGMEELILAPKEIVRITDLMGKDRPANSDGLLIIHFSDGTLEKRIGLN